MTKRDDLAAAAADAGDTARDAEASSARITAAIQGTEPEAADPPAQPKPISEKDAAKALYRYRGKGTISGVPARDLTVLDVERLTPDQLRAAIVAPPGGKALYEAV
jgi:hypothetical protein